MNSQFILIQQIYRIIANGNVQDLILFNSYFEELLNQSRNINNTNNNNNNNNSSSFHHGGGNDSSNDLQYFYSLYPKILDRLFGGNCTGYQDDEIHFQTNMKWNKGDDHGWLKQLISSPLPLSLPSTVGGNNNSGANNNNPSNFLKSSSSYLANTIRTNTSSSSTASGTMLYSSTQQLKHVFLQFFHPYHKLFLLLERTNYELHISLLSEKLQQLVSRHPISELFWNNNNMILLLSLLFRCPFHEMKKLLSLQRGRLFQPDMKSISLDPLEYYMIFLIRYPILSNQLFSDSSGSFSGNILKRTSSLDLYSDTKKGAQHWVLTIPYLNLLQIYLDELLPLKHPQKGTADQNPGTSNTSMMALTRSYSTHEQEQYVNKYRQLFIQLIIGYWIDLLIVIREDHQSLPKYRKLARAGTGTALHDISMNDFNDSQYQSNNRAHPSPLELTLLDPVCKWTIPTCQSLYLFLFHLQRRNGEINQELQMHAMRLLDDNFYEQPSLTSLIIWKQLQLPVFDMLSFIFDRGDESSIDREVVFTAIEIWLLWIQPWQNVTASTMKVEGLQSPKTSSGKNAIEQHWNYYIHSNYHFYSTLFIYFIRMISKCNVSLIDHLTSRASSPYFSSSSYSSFASSGRNDVRDVHNNVYHEGNRYLMMLEKVMRVFSGSFCSYLEKIGKEYVEWYSEHYLSSDGGGIFSPDHSNLKKLFRNHRNNSSKIHPSDSNSSLNTVVSNDSLVAMVLVRDHHFELFPDRRIDLIENIGITSLRTDSKLFAVTIFQNLQNQIDLLKMKKRGLFPEVQVYLAIFTSFLFDDSQAETNGKIAKRLSKVQEQLITIFTNINFQQYLHQSQEENFASTSEDSNFASRNSKRAQIRNRFTGKLTLKGRELANQRILQCTAKELNAQLVYSRDPLDLPICSYELFPNWTKFLIHLSKRLNEYNHLPKNATYIHTNWEEIYQVVHQEKFKESLRRSVSAAAVGNSDLFQSIKDYIEENILFYPRLFWFILSQCFRFNLRFLGTFYFFIITNMLTLIVELLFLSLPLPFHLLPLILASILTYIYLFQ